MRDWMKTNADALGLARGRTGEAFAWKVREKLADNGVAGLVLAAKTLTNDHLKPWRAKFFSSHRVHRVTNFANLAYVIFPKVKEAAMTVTFGLPQSGKAAPPILHVGPFVANQVAISHSRKAWVVGITESEMKSVDATDASRGNASTWKLALWGNHRDVRDLARLKALWPSTLKSLAITRGWHLALGLQLRNGPGEKWVDENGVERQENQYVSDLEGLPLLKHRALVKAGPMLDFSSGWLGKNTRGCFVRGGRKKGLGLVKGPHVFLWNDWAAFSEDDCIIEHSKVAIAGQSKDSDWLRAISLVWTSSITQFCLVLELSSDWGFGRSLIDLGDAENMRMPTWDESSVKQLGGLHRELVGELRGGVAFDTSFRRRLDQSLSALLKLPSSMMELATDFAIERMSFNQGVVPDSAKKGPNSEDLLAYAGRLTTELDDFISGKGRHRITVLHSGAGVCASIEITREKKPILPTVRAATGADAKTLRDLLAAAEQEFSQWVYVKRSVRIMAGDTLHLIKPPRRCEWTEGRALLDAADVIAEIAARRK